jgi:hypothetical protein
MVPWCRVFFLLVIAGCASDDKAADASGDTASGPSEPVLDTADSGSGSEPAPDPVLATIRVLDPLSSAGVEGLVVADLAGDGSCVTGDAGGCDFSTSGQSAFQFSVTGDAYLAHHLFGLTGAADFTTISFIATASMTDQVYNLLRVARDPAAGVLVVGLDRPDLSPATGAQASIDGDSELSFVFGPRQPVEGDTLVDGGSSIVTFVNVPPGPVTVTATGADGTVCAAAPAGQVNTHPVEATAGVVTVVSFICD